jgi:hypothetical protein
LAVAALGPQAVRKQVAVKVQVVFLILLPLLAAVLVRVRVVVIFPAAMAALEGVALEAAQEEQATLQRNLLHKEIMVEGVAQTLEMVREAAGQEALVRQTKLVV